MTLEQQQQVGLDPIAVDRLAAVLSSKVRAALLCWMVPRPGERASLTDLSRETGMAISSLQHECYKLVRLGVLVDERDGQSRLYAMRLDTAFGQALVSLVVAAIGLESAIETAAMSLGTFEEVALALRPGDERTTLLLVGNASLEALATLQNRVASLLGSDPELLSVAYFESATWDGDPAVRQSMLARLRGSTVHRVHGSWPPVD